MQELIEDPDIQAIYDFVVEQIDNGVSEEQIRSMVVEKGLDQESAAGMVLFTKRSRLRAIKSLVAEQMDKGVCEKDIQAMLIARGFDRASATNMVFDISKSRFEQARMEREENMLYGALWCIGGIVVTGVTYSIAAPGGVYVVAWGAIVFGALQFLMGVTQKA